MAALTCRPRSHPRPQTSSFSEAQRQWRFNWWPWSGSRTTKQFPSVWLSACFKITVSAPTISLCRPGHSYLVLFSLQGKRLSGLMLQWVRGCVADTIVWFSSLYSNTNSYLAHVVHTWFTSIKQNWFQLYHISFIKCSQLKQFPFSPLSFI